MENKAEFWKKHPDINKIEVSSFGRVRSVKGHYYTGRPDKGGYLKIRFRVNGKLVNKYVHRLVAQAFIQNPNNLPEINHKNCVRDDNRVINLEFCTRSYNNQYREKYGVSQAEAAGHPLFAINLSTLEVSQFRSQHEASKVLGVDYSSISKVVKGKLKQSHGYYFVNDDGHAVDIVKNKLHDIGKTGLKI